MASLRRDAGALLSRIRMAWQDMAWAVAADHAWHSPHAVVLLGPTLVAHVAHDADGAPRLDRLAGRKHRRLRGWRQSCRSCYAVPWQLVAPVPG